jgi:hypothetical protein
MDKEAREAAEAFIEQAAGRAAPARETDNQTARARAEAAREDAELVRRELMRLCGSGSAAPRRQDAGRIDVERLDALAVERSDARRARAEQARRRAIDASDVVARRLAELTPILPVPADPVNVIIDRVTFIRSFADAGVVVDSGIDSLDSWARYRLNASGDSVQQSSAGRLSFFTVWQNPRSEPVVVTAGAQLIVNAYLSVDADGNGVGAWFGFRSEARATVRARTTVWYVPDSAVHAIVYDAILDDAGASGGFFGDDDSASIAVNEFLPAAGFAVPAQESILIEVEGDLPEAVLLVLDIADRVGRAKRFHQPRRRERLVPGLGAVAHPHADVARDVRQPASFTGDPQRATAMLCPAPGVLPDCRGRLRREDRKTRSTLLVLSAHTTAIVLAGKANGRSQPNR